MLTLQDHLALAQHDRYYHDPDYDMATSRYREPDRCRACDSVETSAGRCRWCRSEREERYG